MNTWYTCTHTGVVPQSALSTSVSVTKDSTIASNSTDNNTTFQQLVNFLKCGSQIEDVLRPVGPAPPVSDSMPRPRQTHELESAHVSKPTAPKQPTQSQPQLLTSISTSSSSSSAAPPSHPSAHVQVNTDLYNI